MLRARAIPLLLLHDGALVKTVRFDHFAYIGDPVNTVRIFNELEVDEIILLDILASAQGREPEFALVEQIASECFMPLTYGGGIRSVDDAHRLFDLGIEKISVNSATADDATIIGDLAARFGSQSVVASIDVRRRRGDYEATTHRATRPTGEDATAWARRMAQQGAGELLVTAVDRDGTWQGLDLALIEAVSDAVAVPVIAGGGACDLEDIARGVAAGAQAVAAGSLFVYQRRDFGVLVNYPSRQRLNAALAG